MGQQFRKERADTHGQASVSGYSKDEKTIDVAQNDNKKFKEDKYIKAYQAMFMK
jgi:hypothetical protein